MLWVGLLVNSRLFISNYTLGESKVIYRFLTVQEVSIPNPSVVQGSTVVLSAQPDGYKLWRKDFPSRPRACSQQRMKEARKQGRLSPAQPVLPTASLSVSFNPPSPIHFAMSCISNSKYKDDIFPSCL